MVDEPITILKFCEMFGISRYTYYRMRKRGEGPRETVVSPRRSVIFPEALREWERRQESADPDIPAQSQPSAGPTNER